METNSPRLADTSPPISPRSKFARSRVTNGRALFTGKVDGRTTEARRMRDLIQEFAEPFGGMKNAPELVRQVIRHAAAVAVASEQEQAALARGEDVDPYLLTQLAGTFSGLVTQLDPTWRKTVRIART